MQGLQQVQSLFERLFHGDPTLIEVVYLAAMFVVVFWRRDTVVNWSLYRTSYLLFAAALVAPHIARPIADSLAQSSPVAGQPFPITAPDGQFFANLLAGAVGPTLLAGAIICGLGSMIPRPGSTSPTTASTPPKHPLD